LKAFSPWGRPSKRSAIITANVDEMVGALFTIGVDANASKAKAKKMVSSLADALRAKAEMEAELAKVSKDLPLSEADVKKKEAGLAKVSKDLSVVSQANGKKMEADLHKASKALSVSEANGKKMEADLHKASKALSMMDANFAECAKALLTIGADLTKEGGRKDGIIYCSCNS